MEHAAEGMFMGIGAVFFIAAVSFLFAMSGSYAKAAEQVSLMSNRDRTVMEVTYE